MIHKLLMLAAINVLTGCALLGLPTPKTFEEKLATGYTTVTGLRKTAGVLLESGRISSSDARNIQDSADVARQGLDVSELVFETSPTEGNARLDATLLGIDALITYLETKNGRGQPASSPNGTESDITKRKRPGGSDNLPEE